MKSITGFNELIDRFCTLERVCRVVVVCPDDEPTINAMQRCLAETNVEFIVVTKGNPLSPELKISDRLVVIECQDADSAAAKAVALIRAGKADVLMKGNINTDNLLRAVLNKEVGLLAPGSVMAHIAVAEAPAYSKLLVFSDAAVIPRPDLAQFKAMVGYDVDVCRKLGVKDPKVALIHFTEKVNARFQHTLDYEELKNEAEAGAFGEGVILGGPMDVKTACDPHSGDIKGIASPVCGCADALIFPNLESANTFYKTLVLFGQGRVAAMIGGTTAPVVVPSRADSAESKFLSLALACVAGLN